MSSREAQSPMPGSSSLAPFAIPAGRYRIDRALDDEIRAAALAPAREAGDERSHPIFAFLAALGGMGVSVAELCRMCGSSIEAGPVLARTTIDYGPPMVVDREYRIEGSVAAIVRKPSRRFGAADHVTIELAVGSDDVRFADVMLAWVMPQAEEGA